MFPVTEGQQPNAYCRLKAKRSYHIFPISDSFWSQLGQGYQTCYRIQVLERLRQLIVWNSRKSGLQSKTDMLTQVDHISMNETQSRIQGIFSLSMTMNE